MKMPEKCEDCSFCQLAYDSEIFDEDEAYCCIKGQSVQDVFEEKRAEFCPLIEDK